MRGLRERDSLLKGIGRKGNLLQERKGNVIRLSLQEGEEGERCTETKRGKGGGGVALITEILKSEKETSKKSKKKGRTLVLPDREGRKKEKV